MMTATRTPARVIVFWNNTEGWTFRAEDNAGAIERGTLHAEQNDLHNAIKAAIIATGIDAHPGDFNWLDNVGGVAMWYKP